MSSNYINRLQNYTASVDREDSRVKITGEVFTPTELVQEILDNLDQSLFEMKLTSKQTAKTFIDPSCGDGQFLSEVLIRKLISFGKSRITDQQFELALGSIYGVDIMADNVRECRDRLLCGHEEFRHIVEQNILVGNTLDPTADIEGQTELDKSRMRELFYKDPEELIVDELGLPLPVEKHKKHHKKDEFIINTGIFEED